MSNRNVKHGVIRKNAFISLEISNILIMNVYYTNRYMNLWAAITIWCMNQTY